MTTKQYLSQYRIINRRIDSLVEELSRWRSMAARITPNYSERMGQGGAPSDRLQTAVGEIVELEQQINAEIDVLVVVRDEVTRAIDSVPDEKLRTLLRLRYINGLKWSVICAVIERAENMTRCKLHPRALSKIKNIQNIV